MALLNRGVVGQLKGARDPINVEWEIADFQSLPAQVDEYHESPMFFFCDTSMYLRLFPNGQTCHSSEGHVAVYVMRGDSGPPVSLTFSLFLKKKDGREEVMNEGKMTFERKDFGWGKKNAIKRSELMERKSEFMPSGTLTVICSLKCDGVTSGAEKLSSDLKNLVISGDESDVTVVVEGEEFRLHRAILAARTPVFSSMFTHNMKEKVTGIVTIDDCEAGPFRAFVHYLYTGSTEEISQKNACGLYRMADKYQVDELKVSCSRFLEQTLCADTFCDVVHLAMRHGEDCLMEKATDFLSENVVDIIGTKEWRMLLRDNMIEVNEMLKKALVRKEKK